MYFPISVTWGSKMRPTTTNTYVSSRCKMKCYICIYICINIYLYSHQCDLGLKDEAYYDQYKFIFPPDKRGDNGDVDDGECFKTLLGGIQVQIQTHMHIHTKTH